MSGIKGEDLEKISDLIKLLKSSGVDSFTWEKEDEKLELNFSGPGQVVIQSPAHQVGPNISTHSAPPTSVVPPNSSQSSLDKTSEKTADKNIVEVKSPFVGTFYKRPSPDADTYVEIGDKVTKGTVLCIVEAMKLMNEIESEVDGILEEVVATDTEPVEYGEVLFRVRVKK